MRATQCVCVPMRGQMVLPASLCDYHFGAQFMEFIPKFFCLQMTLHRIQIITVTRTTYTRFYLRKILKYCLRWIFCDNKSGIENRTHIQWHSYLNFLGCRSFLIRRYWRRHHRRLCRSFHIARRCFRITALFHVDLIVGFSVSIRRQWA